MSKPRAFEVICESYCCVRITFAESAAKARYESWRDARDADYEIKFGAFKVKRLPELDDLWPMWPEGQRMSFSWWPGFFVEEWKYNYPGLLTLVNAEESDLFRGIAGGERYDWKINDYMKAVPQVIRLQAIMDRLRRSGWS